MSTDLEGSLIVQAVCNLPAGPLVSLVCTDKSEVWGAESDKMLAEVQGWCRRCREGAGAVQVVQGGCRGGAGGAGGVQVTCTNLHRPY